MTAADATDTDGYVAFRHRDFRLHCGSRLIMGIAMSMQAVAIGWYVSSVTRSPLALGIRPLAKIGFPSLGAASLDEDAAEVDAEFDVWRKVVSEIGLEPE